MEHMSGIDYSLNLWRKTSYTPYYDFEDQTCITMSLSPVSCTRDTQMLVLHY